MRLQVITILYCETPCYIVDTLKVNQASVSAEWDVHVFISDKKRKGELFLV